MLRNSSIHVHARLCTGATLLPILIMGTFVTISKNNQSCPTIPAGKLSQVGMSTTLCNDTIKYNELIKLMTSIWAFTL